MKYFIKKNVNSDSNTIKKVERKELGLIIDRDLVEGEEIFKGPNTDNWACYLDKDSKRVIAHKYLRLRSIIDFEL